MLRNVAATLGRDAVRRLRQVFAAGEQRGALSVSPFSERGYEQFVAWLGGHDEDHPAGITRILAGIYVTVLGVRGGGVLRGGKDDDDTAR